MMKHYVKISCYFAIIVSISGCAAVLSSASNVSVDEAVALKKTAEYFGASESRVKITNFQKNIISAEYRAIYKNTLYNCVIQYGGVECSRPGG